MIDPPACQRGGRTTEQHFVPQPDAPVDLRVDVVTREHLVFVKPAANAMVLELVMEMLGERLVSMVVADEARIILDRCGCTEVNQGIADSGDLPGS